MQIKRIHEISVNRVEIGVDRVEIGLPRFWPESYANAVLKRSIFHADHSLLSVIAQC